MTNTNSREFSIYELAARSFGLEAWTHARITGNAQRAAHCARMAARMARLAKTPNLSYHLQQGTQTFHTPSGA